MSETETKTTSSTCEQVYFKMGSIHMRDGFEQSANDNRRYRAIRLKNDLTALLISDKEAEKSGAALDVHVGHFSDPDTLPGLAHFLEHMLFLGTKKYPNENSYGEYLQSHGGSSNAYTACAHTNYQFDVTPPHLEEALDRFAQFFVCPLFTASATDRELLAVDSENAKNLQNDSWRLYQLTKSLSKKDHPFNSFGTGNLQTLKVIPEKAKIDTRESLLAFHKKYYSANIMKLVVLGTDDLDTLQKWVEEKFSGIENKKIDFPSFPNDPFGDKILTKQINVLPVKDLRYIKMQFQLPPQKKNYGTKPCQYLSHLLGHEGEGSILAYLKKQGWASALMAGQGTNEDCFATFEVTIELTESGLSHIDECVESVFQYIAMLKKVGPQRWIYDEVAKISAINVKYKSKSRTFSYVTGLAKSLHYYPNSEVLLGARLLRKYDPKLITETLNLLNPKNMFIIFVSKNAINADDLSEADEEKWYGTKYVDHSMKNIEEWTSPSRENKHLHMPEPNRFVASDLSIRDVPDGTTKTSPPKLIKETESYRLWHKKDPTFKTPKLNVLIRLTLPAVSEGAEALVHINLFSQLIEDHLNEYAYYAEVAGLAYTLEQNDCGIDIKFGGYNDKMADFAKYVLNKVVKYEVNEERFRIIKEKYRLNLKNFDLEQPYQHAMYYNDLCLKKPRYFIKEKLRALESSTPQTLTMFVTRMMSKMFSEALIHGNCSEKEALEFMDVVNGVFKAKAPFASDYPDPRVVKLRQGTLYTFQRAQVNKDQPCSAIHMMYQIDLEYDEWRLQAMVSLLAQVVKEPFFDKLRTKEQLGYLVWSGSSEMWGVLGVRFILQSDKATVEYLQQRILTFVRNYRTTLASMEKDKFEKNREALIALKLQKPKKLGEETHRYWSQITKRTYVFDHRELEVAELRKITLEDLVAFYDKFMMESGSEWRVLCSRTTGNCSKVTLRAESEKDKEDDSGETKNINSVDIKDFEAFKHSMPLYPVRAYLKSKSAAASAKL